MVTATNNDDIPLIEIRALHVSFGRQNVLRDINLKIPRGQTLAIIGESGCGKTVLLKTIIALIPPTAGRVLFEGQDMMKLSEKQLTQQRIRFGFLFQGGALFDSMTVLQNVAFPLRQHRRTSERAMRDVVLERLREVGLPEEVVTKKPAELSGGMRKRVALARALAMHPEMMLYDEPTTGLDPIMSDVINQLILRTQRRHPVTSIVVTHDMRTTAEVADRVVMLYPIGDVAPDENQIIFDGTPQQLRNSSDRRVEQFVLGRAGDRLGAAVEQTAAQVTESRGRSE